MRWRSLIAACLRGNGKVAIVCFKGTIGEFLGRLLGQTSPLSILRFPTPDQAAKQNEAIFNSGAKQHGIDFSIFGGIFEVISLQFRRKAAQN